MWGNTHLHKPITRDREVGGIREAERKWGGEHGRKTPSEAGVFGKTSRKHWISIGPGSMVAGLSSVEMDGGKQVDGDYLLPNAEQGTEKLARL